MKKPLIYASITTLALLAGITTTILTGSTNATESTNTPTTSEIVNPIIPNNLASKDESVYIITNSTGSTNQIFVGSTLATAPKPLPLNLDISYMLDGAAISASDLAGKSGHVKISYTYTATSTHQGKLVPFLAVTGLQLDGNKFSNIKLNNGKIISEKDNYTIVGYSFAGLNSDLGTNLLPDSFTLEADVHNFELGNAYAFATNEIFADLDTSKLDTIDGLINSMSQLESGINQILSGTTQLNSGLDSLVAGVTKLQAGAESLNSGASRLATGASSLSDGAATLADGLSSLNAGVNDLATNVDALTNYLDTLATNGATLNAYISSATSTIISQINTALAGTGYTITIDNYGTILPAIISSLTDESLKATLTNAKNSLDLYINIQNYIAGVTSVAAGADQLNANMPLLTTSTSQLSDGANSLATGASELSTGTNQLLAGTVSLKAGVDQLANGATQLSTGGKALESGIQTFKSEGIDRLVNFANHDLASFTTNARATVDAAKSYHSYQTPTATSVKFIFKTPSIK